MVASVAIYLWTPYVILYGNDPDIILSGQHTADVVNIVDKRTDHADSRNIVQILSHRLYCHRKASALQLLKNALRLLYAGSDHLNGISLVSHGKLVVQHLQLCLKLPDCAGILHHLIPELYGLADQALRHFYLSRSDHNGLVQLAVRILVKTHIAHLWFVILLFFYYYS